MLDGRSPNSLQVNGVIAMNNPISHTNDVSCVWESRYEISVILLCALQRFGDGNEQSLDA